MEMLATIRLVWDLLPRHVSKDIERRVFPTQCVHKIYLQYQTTFSNFVCAYSYGRRQQRGYAGSNMQNKLKFLSKTPSFIERKNLRPLATLARWWYWHWCSLGTRRLHSTSGTLWSKNFVYFTLWYISPSPSSLAFGREPTVSFVDIWFKALIDVEEQNIISLSGSAGGCGENPLVRQTTCSSRRDVYSAWQGEARFGFFGKRNT